MTRINAAVRGKRGSSSVFLAMAFVAFAICIAGAIGISRKLTVKSECESYGRVWTRAILSEYDRNLLKDYGLMAYFGNEVEVRKKIDTYLDFSVSGRLDAHIAGSGADLSGYELGDPANFRKALKLGFGTAAADTLLNGTSRSARPDGGNESEDAAGEGDAFGYRIIGNQVVIDTLPSGGGESSISSDHMIEKAKSAGSSEGVRSSVANAGIEVAFIQKYFGNNVTSATDKKCWFRNEWEYIIKGSLSDDENRRACRNKIFIMRNALNLVSLYKDPAKVEFITSVAETIAPGPVGAAVQVLIAEAWAALETEEDLKALYNNERVPVIKSPEQWKTGAGKLINSSKLRKKLDEESKKLLDENSSEIDRMASGINDGGIITEGLNYDDHLMLMILSMNKETRLLRIMDLVQINMKYRYYRDFNLMEYFTGVRFGISANGKDYLFEDSYK